MSRLSKTELRDHRAWLAEWHTPAEMAAHVAMVNDKMGYVDFFNQSGVEFLRDAWLAAEFGRHRQSKFVHLVPDREQWPDFEVKDQSGKIEQIECVEADEPNRRRGDYYQGVGRRVAAGESTIEPDPVENWIARAEQVPAALSTAVNIKLKKHYAGRADLLVHLNIHEFGIRQKEIEAAMEPAVIPALPAFQSVWILWNEKLYGPWSALNGSSPDLGKVGVEGRARDS